MRLDHVVHVVADRERATEALRSLGLRMVTGGEHPGWGTHNALAYFEDLSYIELVAVHNRAEAAASAFGAAVLRFAEAGDGVLTFPLRTAEIDGDVARLRARGIAIADPTPGSRRLPDGSLLTWRLALAPFPLPFLIQWEAPDEARRADLAARGALNPPGRRVAEGFWAVTDLEEAARRLAEGYGWPLGAPCDHPHLAARCLPTGSGITLCAPTGPGPVQERLDRRGEGPVGYSLSRQGAPVQILGSTILL
ncbi:MAG: VOC family protein [Bacillota bacterium]